MATTAVLGTDGSDLSNQALAAGWSVLRPVDRVIVVTVIENLDPMLVFDGGGHAGPTVSPDELASMQETARADGEVAVRTAVDSLGIDDVETRVLEGEPGPTLCAFAEEASANVIVLGTRGRGRFKRALLGSVSDYVVRNASCPVVVTGESGSTPAG
jgi:nucleotide-binding universal stress UspA family protein